MYLSKDADSVPTFESPLIHREWTLAPRTCPSPLERKHEGPAHIQRSPVSALEVEMKDPFPALSRKNSQHSRRISKGGTLHRKGERKSKVVPPLQQSPSCLSPFQRNVFSLQCIDFDAEDQLTPRWHVGQPCGKALRESHRSLDLPNGMRGTAATDREKSAHTCPHSRRGLTPLWSLQQYPKIHVSTGEESSGSGPGSTQGLRLRHRRERNPERPPSNSNGDWPFLRPPERVAEVPILSREHLPQL